MAAIHPAKTKQTSKPAPLNPADGWRVIEAGGVPLACPECKVQAVYYFAHKRAAFCIACGKKVEEA